MLRQFLVGTAVSVCNIAIHAMVMVTVIRVARIAGETCNVASISSTDRCHDCDRIGLDGRASCRSARLVIWLTRSSVLHLPALISFILPL